MAELEVNVYKTSYKSGHHTLEIIKMKVEASSLSKMFNMSEVLADGGPCAKYSLTTFHCQFFRKQLYYLRGCQSDFPDSIKLKGLSNSKKN